jgi:hypothetical protein
VRNVTGAVLLCFIFALIALEAVDRIVEVLFQVRRKITVLYSWLNWDRNGAFDFSFIGAHVSTLLTMCACIQHEMRERREEFVRPGYSISLVLFKYEKGNLLGGELLAHFSNQPRKLLLRVGLTGPAACCPMVC